MLGETSDDVIFMFYENLESYISPREIKRKINLYALFRTGIVKKDMFLIMAIMNRSINLIRKFRKITSKWDDFIKKHKLSQHDFQNYIDEYLFLKPVNFIEIFYEIKEIEKTTFAFEAGEEHKQNLILQIYAKCAINHLSRIENFSKQFEDYLGVYLVESSESPATDW